MPTRYRLIPDVSLIVIRYEGVVETDEVVAAYSDYRNSDGYDPKYHHLIDMSPATTLNIDFGHMLRLVSRIGAMSTLRTDESRTALYAPGDVQFGVGRMYQSLAEDRVPFQIGVFRSKEEALGFLDMTPEDTIPAWDAAFSAA